jgi:acid phosphatase type 7
MTRESLFLLLLAPLAAQAADTLVGGPYVVNAGPRSATVCWVEQESEVRLGSAPDRLTSVAPVLRSRKVTYADLKPGGTYYYDVNGTEAGKGRFKTPPEGDADFNFIVYGDTRTRHALHQKVVDAMLGAEPDFVVHTGDLVSNGGETALWPIFFDIEKELLRKTVFFPSLGNHERNNPQYYDFFDVKTPYYSFTWGGAHFVVLNSDFANAALSAAAKEQFWTEQKLWMEDDLRASQKATFRFLVFHHPPFTAVKRRQDGNERVAGLVPLFEQYKVTAVFNGHDHAYQRHVKNGVQYIVTGGGGAPLYAVDAPIPGITQKVESTEHYVLVKVAGKTAHIQAIALDGHTIDEADLK